MGTNIFPVDPVNAEQFINVKCTRTFGCCEEEAITYPFDRSLGLQSILDKLRNAGYRWVATSDGTLFTRDGSRLGWRYATVELKK